MPFLPDYCGSEYVWTAGVFTNETATIPLCFDAIVFSLIPALTMLIAFPWTCYLMRSYKTKEYTKKFKYRYSPLFLTKMILTIAIMGIYIYVAVYGGIKQSEEDIYPARLGAPLLTLCAYLISLVLEFFVHYCEQKRSGILFTFRVYMLVGSIIRVLEIYLKEPRNYNEGVSISILIIDSLLVLSSSVAEPSVVSEFTPSSENECPELYSGFPSIATFWWFNSLIMLGYRSSDYFPVVSL